MIKKALIELIVKPQSGEWGKDDSNGEGVPVIRTANFTDIGKIDYSNIVTRDIPISKMEKKALSPGDIIIEKSGGSDTKPVGRVVYYDGPSNKYLYNNFTAVLRVKNENEILPKYLFYYMYSFYQKKGTLRYENKTTGLHNLKLEQMLNEVKIPIINVFEQEKIVAILDKIKVIFEYRELQLKILDFLIKSQFVEMFGDPVQNPKNWKMEKVERHIDLLSGFPFDSSQYVDEGIKICGGLIIMPQRIEWDECKHWRSIDGFEDYLLNQNDIVIALDRPWISEGFKIAMVDEENLPALLIQRTVRIRAIDINQYYLFHYFVNGSFDSHCNVTGSLVPHISAKDIRSFMIMLPPLELQYQFATFVKQTDKLKVTIQKSINEIQLLYDGLMQKFFE